MMRWDVEKLKQIKTEDAKVHIAPGSIHYLKEDISAIFKCKDVKHRPWINISQQTSYNAFNPVDNTIGMCPLSSSPIGTSSVPIIIGGMISFVQTKSYQAIPVENLRGQYGTADDKVVALSQYLHIKSITGEIIPDMDALYQEYKEQIAMWLRTGVIKARRDDNDGDLNRFIESFMDAQETPYLSNFNGTFVYGSEMLQKKQDIVQTSQNTDNSQDTQQNTQTDNSKENNSIYYMNKEQNKEFYTSVMENALKGVTISHESETNSTKGIETQIKKTICRVPNPSVHYGSMGIQDKAHFVQLCIDCGSFSMVAKKYNVTAPTIKTWLRRCESDLKFAGVELPKEIIRFKEGRYAKRNLGGGYKSSSK